MRTQTLLRALVIVMTLLLTGCSSKAPMTADSFTDKAESAGYVIIDATDQLEDGLVESYTVAVSDDYQIEFFIVPTEQQAKQAFNENQSNFEDLKGSSSTNSSVSAANYSRYSLTTDGMFYVISRIDNTLIYASVPAENKDEVRDFIKALGYL